MKKLYLTTLTAICMMSGMSLLKANNTIMFTNNSPDILSIHLKAKHKKAGQTRHDEDTLTVPASNTATWGYNGDIEFIDITDTVNGKHTHLVQSLGYNTVIASDYSISTISSDGQKNTTGWKLE